MIKEPTYKATKFQCPHCQVTSQQKWFDNKSLDTDVYSIINTIFINYRTSIDSHDQETNLRFINRIKEQYGRYLQYYVSNAFAIATCGSCHDISVWIDKEIIYPKAITLPPANEDMDIGIQDLYHEAALILSDSPKGSTALLRLALQMLLKQVGKSGKKINTDIKELVAEGLSPKIQQALDILRVVGNNAVHPGQIDIDDNKGIALKLFNILNFIADELLTKPKELESLYSDIIPEETQGHIEERDK